MKENDPFINFCEEENAPTALIKTSMGDISIRLLDEAAPLAVENFLTHSKNGYYDGVIFHRVIRGFMIQSGDPQGNGTGGKSIWGKPFKNEVSSRARNFRGAVAMANAGPDTNGSQFYIVQAGTAGLTEDFFRRIEAQTGQPFPPEAVEKYLRTGGAPWLDGGYTVFGQVITGMDTVDAIAAVQVDSHDKPVEKVSILKISAQG